MSDRYFRCPQVFISIFFHAIFLILKLLISTSSLHPQSPYDNYDVMEFNIWVYNSSSSMIHFLYPKSADVGSWAMSVRWSTKLLALWSINSSV